MEMSRELRATSCELLAIGHRDTVVGLTGRSRPARGSRLIAPSAGLAVILTSGYIRGCWAMGYGLWAMGYGLTPDT